jgi:hypothetical protein
VYYKRLDREAFLLLSALREGKSLGDACEHVFAASSAPAEQNAENLRDWFAVWTRLGWLTKSAFQVDPKGCADSKLGLTVAKTASLCDK